MCAYNRVNQVGSCENKEMVSGVLKGELGFQGFVVSDWAAIDDEGNRGKIGPWGSVEAGVDVNNPGKGVFYCFFFW
jgi:beta-glucosidase-like glycosyl hydrolase